MLRTKSPALCFLSQFNGIVSDCEFRSAEPWRDTGEAVVYTDKLDSAKEVGIAIKKEGLILQRIRTTMLRKFPQRFDDD